jgi:hypothetical protein
MYVCRFSCRTGGFIDVIQETTNTVRSSLSLLSCGGVCQIDGHKEPEVHVLRRMRWWLRCSLLTLAAAGGLAYGKPSAPATFCVKYAGSPMCVGGQPACSLCHQSVPQRNSYGAALEAALLPSAPRPLSDGDFTMALPAALSGVESADSDGDQSSNVTEIQRGTWPGDAQSVPVQSACAAGSCQYSLRYVYRKLSLDFCGYLPPYAQMKQFDALATDDLKRAFLDAELDRCLGSDFWRGKNGALWKMAHPKIRPVGSLKAGEDEGIVQLADYYDDYALFTWAHIDDHDVRDVLRAQFFVRRSGSNPTVYSSEAALASQRVDAAHRAGNMTTTWTLAYFVMFTALPRNAASQMYRAYLGLDIAKQEGLYSVSSEPRDYDAKGVQQQECAACHATLDPLSYPFRNYNGLTGSPALTNRYVPNRLEVLFGNTAPLNQTPETGFIFGQQVNSLTQWAEVAANSDAFLVSTTTDYWKLLIGHSPTPDERDEFVALWRALKSTHNYRVKPMLHQLIRTEAYGAP